MEPTDRSPKAPQESPGRQSTGEADWLKRARRDSFEIRSLIEQFTTEVVSFASNRRQSEAAAKAGAQSVGLEPLDEDRYLHVNPDVIKDIRAGGCVSGIDHWQRFGKAEGRAGAPPARLLDRRVFSEILESRPFGVNLFGYLSSESGLGHAARGVRTALQAAGIPLNEIDLKPWRTREEERDPLPSYDPFRINLFVLTGDIMPLFVSAHGEQILWGAYNIGYWFWELNVPPPDWSDHLRYVDEIWVASEFCRAAFECITALPVRRFPPALHDLEDHAPFGREHFGIPAKAFVFFYAFDVSSYMIRKNPLALVRAFLSEFEEEDDVMLLLKITRPDSDPEGLRTLRRAVGTARNIRIITDLLTEEENLSLHKVIDCLVSPHRGEGLGFNLLEAMYFGKAAIATAYSSNLDYMNEGNSYLVKYRLRPIERTIGPYVKDALWAEPQERDLARRMREVYSGTAVREIRSARAATEIRDDFSPKKIGKEMASRFEELGLHEKSIEPAKLWGRQTPARPRLFADGTPHSVKQELLAWPHKPIISVITPVYNVEATYLRECIESVRAQWYPFWELCICDDASTNKETIELLEEYRGTDARIKITRSSKNLGISGASNRCAEISIGEFLAMVDNDDTVTPDALLEIARAMNTNPNTDLLYTDEDKIAEDGSYCDHYFKPDFSPEHLRSVMYLLHLLVIRKTLFYDIGGFRDEYSGAQDYDLSLRASAVSDRIAHVPKVLYHWRKISGSAAAVLDAKPTALLAGRHALEDHVSTLGLGSVEDGMAPGTFRVRYRIGNPRVTLLVLSGDQTVDVEGRGRVHLLTNFLRTLVERTEYKNYEILIVHDGEPSEKTKQSLTRFPLRRFSYQRKGPKFNFSEMANFGFSKVETEHLLLLNDDMEVISPDWLNAMIEPLAMKEVGIVGARLIYPKECIQHVGMVLGVHNGAAHAFYDLPRNYIGYNAYTHLIRNYSCVTAACIALRQDVIRAVGGFDPIFATDYNDVDFCLRVREAGYRIVYTPFAELYHFEGKSCIRLSQNPAEVALFNNRWQRLVSRDPYYNPNLSRDLVDFSADPNAWPGIPEPAVAVAKA